MKNQFERALKAKVHRDKSSPSRTSEKSRGLGRLRDRAEEVKNGRFISSTRADKK